MKINGMLRALALLLVLIITLGACDFAQGSGADETTVTTTVTPETTVEETTAAQTTAAETTAEETTAEATTKEETTKVETTKEETTKEETTAGLSEYRAGISRTIDEIKAMYTLTDEYFTNAIAKLEEFKALALAGEDVDAVDAAYLEFEDMLNHIETQVGVATLIYYYDTTIEEHNNQYLNAYEKYGDLHNDYIDVCKELYNNSPIRDILFEDWTEDEIKSLLEYSPEIQELNQRNEELLVELNALTDPYFYDRAAEIYAEMVANNNRIAELNGYDNYYDYASVEIYGREYGREEIAILRENVHDGFFANLATLESKWYNIFATLPMTQQNKVVKYLYDPYDSIPKNYVDGYINSFEGSMYEGLAHAFENKNVLFADSPNSHYSAFQMYLPELEAPFCLFGSNGQSASTVVHELGHYYAALYNSDVESYDLAETQSQANEMLFLKYLDGRITGDTYKVIQGYTMYNFAANSIICVIIDEFEQRVYDLESTEGMTSADFDAIMEEICYKYGGLKYLSDNLVDINRYWRQVATNSAVYYISYAASMVASMSLYATAVEDEAAAREIYRILVEETEEGESFTSAIERAGLDSPFKKETFDKLVPIMLNK